MADKDYNVKLQVQLGESVSNIDTLLQKVATLKSAVADIGDKEMALNVVVRNTGFQNAIANINKTLMTMADTALKTGEKAGDSINKGLNKSAEKLKKGGAYDKVAKDIADNLQKEIEGTLKGLEKSLNGISKKVRESLNNSFSKASGESLANLVAESVSKGMIKATKRFSTVGMHSFNTQADMFKDVSAQFRFNNDALSQLKDEVTKYFDSLRELMRVLNNDAKDVMKAAAKERARAEVETKWSEDHMSLKDRAHANVETQRADTDMYRAETERQMVALAQINQSLANEREERKLINAELREETRLQKELEREQSKANAEISKSNAQEMVAMREVEKLEREALAEEERKARVKARSAKQFALIEKAANQESERHKLYETEMEKALYNYQVAENRILSQKQSTLDNARVSESAIANAAKQKRDAEIQIANALGKQLSRYDEIKSKMETSVESTRQMATNLQRASSAISSVGGIFSTIRSVSTSLAGMIKSAGATFLGYARQAATTLKDSALEQYQSLQTAQIGFKNFFGSNAADDLIKQIREQAMKAPGVDAGQLADYVKQVAPVSNHNAQLAMDAALGMIKTIQYGGAEASQEMEYVIKNVRDVIAKGMATAIDLRQFNRAMPIMEEVLSAVGASDFIKNGTLKIDKNNAKDLLNAFAKINNDPESPVRNIFSQMEHTLSGITDIIKQTFVTRFNETLEGFGFYEKLQKMLENFYNSGAIEKFYNFLATAVNNILRFVEKQDWDKITAGFAEGFKNIWQAFKEVANMTAKTLNGADLGSIIQKLLSMIANFIKGFGQGVNQLLQIVSWADKNLAPGTLNRLANLLGTIASPLGKLIQSGFSLAQNFANLGSRLLYMKAENLKTNVLGKLDAIMTVIANPSIQQHLLAASKNGAILNIGAASDTIYNKGSLTNRDTAMYSKEAGTVAWMNRDGSWSAHGGTENLTKKELNSLLRSHGLPSTSVTTATAYLKKTANAIKEVGTKFIKAGAIYAVGEGLTTVATEVARVVGGNGAADITKKLGDILSASVALGSQFGILGTTVGTVISGLKIFYDGLKEIQKAQKEYADKVENYMYEKTTEDIMYRLIGAFKEAGMYEVGNELDADAQAKMYDNIMWNLKYNKGMSFDDLIKEAEDTYVNTRATNIARENLNTLGKDLNIDSHTPLTDNDMKDLWMAFYRLRDLNLLPVNLQSYVRKLVGDQTAGEWAYTNSKGAEDYTPTDEDFLQHLGVNEILKYFEANGLGLSGREALEEFKKLADDELEKFLGNRKYDAEFIFKTIANGQEYENATEMWKAFGLVWDDRYGWVINATLLLNVKEARETAEQKVSDRMLESWDNSKGLGKLFTWGDKLAGELMKLLGYFNGGRVTPIYRASGSGFAERGVDTVPAMLQPGEFVMRRSAVGKVGTGVLNALNVGDLSKASQLLGAKVSNSWNNARSYVNNANRTYKTVNNRIFVNNRTNSGRVSSYNNLANRIAAGV